jgi:hypothetical protein
MPRCHICGEHRQSYRVSAQSIQVCDDSSYDETVIVSYATCVNCGRTFCDLCGIGNDYCKDCRDEYESAQEELRQQQAEAWELEKEREARQKELEFQSLPDWKKNIVRQEQEAAKQRELAEQARRKEELERNCCSFCTNQMVAKCSRCGKQACSEHLYHGVCLDCGSKY